MAVQVRSPKAALHAALSLGVARFITVYSPIGVTYPQLISEIWGHRPGNIQYLRIPVRKLRQKIEIDPTHLY